MRITNIDTLSALFDRLISENIKLYFFKKEKYQKSFKPSFFKKKEITIQNYSSCNNYWFIRCLSSCYGIKTICNSHTERK